MAQFWMVRAGEKSVLAEDFEREGFVGIGWEKAGDFTGLTTAESIRQRIDDAYADEKLQSRAGSAAQAHKFRNLIVVGDGVVTYDGPRKEYLLGRIDGDYEYRPGLIPSCNHLRHVTWEGRVKKSVLLKASNNTLNSMLTVFEPGDSVLFDLRDALATGRSKPPETNSTSANADSEESFEELFTEFVAQYLTTDRGIKHREFYAKGAETGRANFETIKKARAEGRDITPLVLSKLLPHSDSKPHRANGDWIHVAPAINKDIQSWYEGSGIAKPEDWPKKATLIFDFVDRVTRAPDELEAACLEFSASDMSKGLQSGLLSPILNALRPDRFAIVNSKSVDTLTHFTGDRFKRTIAEYPATNAAIHAFVAENASTLKQVETGGIDPVTAFDMFSHWFVAVREPDENVEEIEDGATSDRRGELKPQSAAAARQIVETICPDAAPRARALEILARAINLADRLRPNAWSVTLKSSVVRLNAGSIVAVDLRKNGLYFVVDESVIDASERSRLAAYDQEENFKWLDNADGYLVPYAQLDPIAALLERANDRLIERSLEKSTRAPWRSAHSPGVLKYLRDIGLKVPDPAYADDLISKGPKVPPPKPPTPANPSYSLADLARETHSNITDVESWIRAINRKGQAIIYGPPGTGKTYTAERLAKHLIAEGDGVVDLVQFHPAYAYEDFILGLRPQVEESGQLQFKPLPGRFMEFCDQADKRSGVSVLIIDEINRANIAQVFGELMFLLEYRDREIPLAGGRRLRIPGKVRILGTMNTADRSVALVDHALRRRFAFIRLYPDFDVLKRFHDSKNRDVSSLVNVLKRVNQAIDDPHFAVGISFFMRERLHEDLEAIWGGEIEPYLEELFFDKPKVADEFRWSKIREQLSF